VDFKKLRISNFKSFVDPVEISIGEGLTGVVGPNGCGKSNLVEALRWAMGETSYKSMRTNSMDDVIFAGTENRPERNFAEVSLVLDNSERNAPKEYNNEETIEVTRRVERESGSAYRINGKDIRARDVQMLFADVSTGARSPSLVRQGQIDELISQKPEQRRRILEEAAGISGFHVRRHEAELRLKAAQVNLERLDDILKEMSSQVRSLKKQAREASRYKALSEDIRKSQAIVFAVKYQIIDKELEDSKKAYSEAVINHQKAVRDLSSISSEEIASQAGLKPLQEKAVANSAKLQRLVIEMEGLDKEFLRQKNRTVELDEFINSTSSQLAREGEILKDLKDLLINQGDNDASFKKKQDVEKEIDRNTENLVKNNALVNEFINIYSKRDNIKKIINSDNDLRESILSQIKRETVLFGELTRSFNVSDEKDSINNRQGSINKAMSLKSIDLQDSNNFIDKMVGIYSQKDTLSKIIGSSLRVENALIDNLNVVSGYENALNALLGDELYYSTDETKPIHWKSLDTLVDESGLPDESEALSKYVSGPSAINRRIEQTGVVSQEDGPRLILKLRRGQRLVSKEGDLWRWDGLVVASTSSKSASERLQQKNKLEELIVSIEKFEEDFESVDKIKEKSIEFQNEITNYKIELDRIQTDVSKRDDLDKKILSSKQELSNLNSKLSNFNKSSLENLKQLEGIDESIGIFEKKFNTINEVRNESDEIQDKITKLKINLDRVNTEINKKEDLDKKIPQTEKQILELNERLANLSEERSKNSNLPAEIEEKRNSLQTLIEESRVLKSNSDDELVGLEVKLKNIRGKERNASEKEAQSRELEGRLEILTQNNDDKKNEIEGRISKDLSLKQEELIKLVDFSEDNPAPSESAAEEIYERFKGERELLGSVNLRAEDEMEDTQTRFDEAKTEREDLDKAITELKKGINGLNQESRARMKLAFDQVNLKFQEVFKKLFGGGEAELNFVDSDDPLEAGLEMLAQPPGKKLKSMDSLSGGEKALTATALIFAVFLTNPSPICVLDEVDAPLDDANVERFCDLIDEMSENVNTKFLIITHHALTMSRMDRLFGITMQEKGVSQIVSVDLNTAEKFRKLA
jgi:chromosome segregation protein